MKSFNENVHQICSVQFVYCQVVIKIFSLIDSNERRNRRTSLLNVLQNQYLREWNGAYLARAAGCFLDDIVLVLDCVVHAACLTSLGIALSLKHVEQCQEVERFCILELDVDSHFRPTYVLLD